MTHTRAEDGTYHIYGKKYSELVGSRAQVWNRTAYKTSGALTRSHLMRNKWGRIVSAKKHRTAKKEKRLQKSGYFTVKGKFGAVKKETRKNRKSAKKMRGGEGDEERPEGESFVGGAEEGEEKIEESI
jgi:DVNP family